MKTKIAIAIQALRKPLSFRFSFFTISLSVALIAVFSIPIKVTVDGINYISSAKALFSFQMSEKYVWYREPGYPFVLRFIHSITDSGIFVVFVQGMFIGIAAGTTFYIVRKAAGQTKTNIIQIVLAVLLVANPLLLIYSGLVLQQALFTLLLSLFGLLIYLAFVTINTTKVLGIIFAAASLYLVATLTSVGWIYLGLLPTSLILGKSVFTLFLNLTSKFRSKRNWGFSFLVSLLIVLVVLPGSYLFATKSYEIWTNYKVSQMPTNFEVANVIKPINKVPYIPTISETASRMLSIMSIGLQEHYVYENNLFLDQQMRRIWPLSEWDTAYVSHPYSDFAKGYFTLENPNVFAHTAISVTSGFATIIYRIIYICSFFALFWAAIKRMWLLFVILLVPWNFICIYALSNSPIDRYGIPGFTFAAASVGIIISWTALAFAKNKQSSID